MHTITEKQRKEIVETIEQLKELNKVLVDALEAIEGDSIDPGARECAEEALMKYRKMSR